ncbi:hypothetical protein FQN54_000517 [Arachnomyces sp. PD_36]|nr:hypothetical protein FQN54_000517 [Arachnomyces sp. PD_36]
MVPKPKLGATKQEEAKIAQQEAPQFERVSWMSNPGLRKLYFYAGIICVASATTGYDGSMLNNLRFIDRFNNFFGDPQGSTLGLLVALYSIGSIASLPVTPFVVDHFGRRAAIGTGCCIMLVGAGVQGGSRNLEMFMGGRFFMGFGNSMAQLSSPLLLAELAHPQHRSRLSSIYNCLWNMGAVICTFLVFGTKYIPSEWSWRIPTIVQAFPSVIQMTFIWFIPESPRWLIAKERHDEALQVLGKYHANGDINDPTVQFEYAEIKETLRLEFLYSKTSTYLDFFKTRGNRYRLLLIISLGLFSQWSGNSLVSYYAVDVYKSIGITDVNTQIGLTGGLNSMSLITSILCAFLVDRVGRRPLFLASTTGMLISFTVWTICSSIYQRSGNKAAGRAVIAMIWTHGFTYAFAWSGLLVAYTVEILPFKIRAKGLMIMNLAIQVALTINNYANPEGFLHLQPNYKFYIIYTVWIAFELIFVFFLYVETKGPTLEEIAKIFDGPNADVAQIHPEKMETEAISSGYTKEEEAGYPEHRYTADRRV